MSGDANRPLVIYHGPNCNDGFTAAWVAWRHFGDGADYYPAQYGTAPPDVTGRDVYLLDFSYKRPAMLRLVTTARQLVVLDHHKTAQAELEGLDLIPAAGQRCLPVLRFDMGKCGARLAWEYFFPDQPMPWLIDLVEDRDLWRWQQPYSRELNAYLGVLSREFATWEETATALDAERRWQSSGDWVLGEHGQRLAERGRAILAYQEQLVEAACRNAVEVEIEGHRVLAVNATVLASEVCERLAEGRPFGACWFVRGDGMKVWSLRSREGGIDVSQVARRRGGGGHRQAAGFEERTA